MSSPAPPARNEPHSSFIRRVLLAFPAEAGPSFATWAILAALSFIIQILLRRELRPGEFGTLNSALGIIGLMLVPVLALHLTFMHALARVSADVDKGRADSLRRSMLLVVETFTWLWGITCALLLSIFLSPLDLPRFSIDLFILMNVLVALGSLLSGAICQYTRQIRLWTLLLVAASFARMILAGAISRSEPWAESGLVAFLLAGFITLIPALRPSESDFTMRWIAFRAVLDRDFIIRLGATFSVMLALFLFSSADRILAQRWLGTPTSFVSPSNFDAYQTAGLLARALLWGTQPLLWIFFATRSRLDRSTSASLFFFWIYLATLLLGVIALMLFTDPLCGLFCGPVHSAVSLTARFVPSLALVMIPLGLLQVLGIFSLASRRYPECFVLGGSSVGYGVLLFLFGQRPELMISYMFGGGLVASMLVLFVGVVRWGRRQP